MLKHEAVQSARSCRTLCRNSAHAPTPAWHSFTGINSPSLPETQIPARHAVVVPARDEDPAESDSLNECLMNDPAEDTAQYTANSTTTAADGLESSTPQCPPLQVISLSYDTTDRQLLAVVKLRWLCLVQAEFLVAV